MSSDISRFFGLEINSIIIITLIKKGLYLELVKDFVNRDKITVLLRCKQSKAEI